MQSDAKLTAVSKPNVDIVLSRSLSIVLGTPMTRSPASCRRLAIDIDPSPPTVISASMPCFRNSATSSSVRSTSDQVPSGLPHGVRRRVAAVRRAEDRAAQVHDAADGLCVQPHDAAPRVLVRDEQPVEPVADADDVPTAVASGERGGTDDGVQAGRVTSAGADGDARDLGGHGRTVPCVPARRAAPPR